MVKQINIDNFESMAHLRRESHVGRCGRSRTVKMVVGDDRRGSVGALRVPGDDLWRWLRTTDGGLPCADGCQESVSAIEKQQDKLGRARAAKFAKEADHLGWIMDGPLYDIPWLVAPGNLSDHTHCGRLFFRQPLLAQSIQFQLEK